MIKICSLEFLNRDFFETDIISESGKVLLKKGGKITPEVLLSLYFKDIYVENWPLDTEEFVEAKTKEASNVDFVLQKEHKSSGPREALDIDYSTPVEAPQSKPIPEIPVEPTPVVNQIPEEIDEDLVFDEGEAKVVASYAVKLAQVLGMPENKIKEVEQVAYYNKIGITKFKRSDLAEKGFEKVLAEESYNILSLKMKAPDRVANAVRFHLKKYDASAFRLNKNNPSDIPYAHILAIVSYYNKLLSNNYTNERALEKMLQLGGNRFNTFALHKFINIMRKPKNATK